jgi:hypothetical protein
VDSEGGVDDAPANLRVQAAVPEALLLLLLLTA